MGYIISLQDQSPEKRLTQKTKRRQKLERSLGYTTLVTWDPVWGFFEEPDAGLRGGQSRSNRGLPWNKDEVEEEGFERESVEADDSPTTIA